MLVLCTVSRVFSSTSWENQGEDLLFLFKAEVSNYFFFFLLSNLLFINYFFTM